MAACCCALIVAAGGFLADMRGEGEDLTAFVPPLVCIPAGVGRFALEIVGVTAEAAGATTGAMAPLEDYRSRVTESALSGDAGYRQALKLL